METKELTDKNEQLNASRPVLSASDLLRHMKIARELYPNNQINGYLVKSRKGTVMSNIIKVINMKHENSYTNVDNIRTAPIYSNQYFVVIELINKNNKIIESTFVTPDLKTYYMRKDGRMKQMTESHNSIILAKLTF